MGSLRSRLSWTTHITWDYVITAVVAAGWLLATKRFPALNLGDRIPAGSLPDLYFGTASVFGIINGLALAGLAFMQASSGRRMDILRAKVGRSVTKSWLSATLAPLAASVWLVALAWIVSAGITWTFWAAAVGGILCVISGIRLGWVLVSIALVDITQDQDRPGASPPQPAVYEPSRGDGGSPGSDDFPTASLSSLSQPAAGGR